MNTNTTIFETSKGLKGTVQEIANTLGIKNNMVYYMAKTGYEVKGHKIINSTTYVRKYNVYQNDELIMTDSIRNIANKLYISESGIRSAIRKKGKILGEYLIKEV